MRKAIVAAALAGLIAPSHAFASTVTVHYSGTVDSWGSGITGFSVGDEFNVTFSYDDTVPNSDVFYHSPDVGLYDAPFISVYGRYSNGVTFSNRIPPGGYIGVVNDVLANGVPGLDVVVFNVGVEGTSIGGLSPRQAGIRLADDSHTALTSGALPDHALPLSLFDQRQFILVMNDSERIFGTISGHDVLPIPATLPLFVTALAGLGFLGWRRAASR